jgi:hypothetical protein
VCCSLVLQKSLSAAQTITVPQLSIRGRTIGKKKTVEETAKKALENGFNDDKTGIDDVQILKPITASTEYIHNRQWNMWVEYVSLPQIRLLY